MWKLKASKYAGYMTCKNIGSTYLLLIIFCIGPLYFFKVHLFVPVANAIVVFKSF